MVNTQSRPEQLASWLDHARERRNKAEESLRQAQSEVAHWTEYAEHLEKLLALENKRHGTARGGISIDPRAPVIAALIQIAQSHDGILVTKKAIKVLRSAGMFPNDKAVRDNIYSTLRHSGDFRKETKGKWVLVSKVERHVQQAPHPRQSETNLSEAIEKLQAQNPTWGFLEIRNHLVQSGFDFGGKKPGNVVNMAMVRQRRKASKPQAVITSVPPPQPALVPQQSQPDIGGQRDVPRL